MSGDISIKDFMPCVPIVEVTPLLKGQLSFCTVLCHRGATVKILLDRYIMSSVGRVHVLHVGNFSFFFSSCKFKVSYFTPLLSVDQKDICVQERQRGSRSICELFDMSNIVYTYTYCHTICD